MTNAPHAFEASFADAFAVYNSQFRARPLEQGSPEYNQLFRQAGQLASAYDIMTEQDLRPKIAINHTETAPGRRSRSIGVPHDPLVTGAERYNKPYVTLFGVPIKYQGHYQVTNALRQTILDTTDLELIPEATKDNFIASTTEIDSIISRKPIPTQRVSFVGRDSREVRSGLFGQPQTYRASVEYFPAVRPTKESGVRIPGRKARKTSTYAEVYTNHTVIPVFGILHLANAFEAS